MPEAVPLDLSDPALIPAWRDGVLQPVDKLEAHRAGLRHKAVSVFVLAGDDILLQRRALGKYHTPGLWANTCCTHPLWGESPEACANRRLMQELGIRDVAPVFRKQLEYRADVGGGLIEHELVDVFTVVAAQDLALVPNPDEVMETRWVDYHDLLAEVRRHPARFTPWLKIYLEQYAGIIFGPDLIRAAHGKRLAKRDDARAIALYRAEGKTPKDVADLIGTPLVTFGRIVAASDQTDVSSGCR